MNYVIKVLEEHLKELIEKDKRTQNMMRIHKNQLKELSNTHYRYQKNINSINEKIEYIKKNLLIKEGFSFNGVY